ncbi:LysE family transporter [Thermodesulfobacteriota bacterium]
MPDPSSFVPAFWGIFSFSFLVALTGAMSPGPLLTYTIIKSVQTNKRGYLMGIWIITGHAILEMGIILFLLLGFSFVLKSIYVVRGIGLTGGAILCYLGGSIIRDVYLNKIPTSFLNSGISEEEEDTSRRSSKLDNPVIGGILVSMSNPYLWIWWATIGFAFMIHFDISFRNWPNLVAFFVGHEAGDLAWYLLISTMAFFGLRHLNKKAYYGFLLICAIFLILFGMYLGISPFLKNMV